MRFMALNIRDPKAHQLAEEVAKRTGETLTRAVIVSLEERLQRLNSPLRRSDEDKRARIRRMKELAARFQALPVVDDRSPDEILHYDEHGLPR
jgi:antitoxin VapB